MLVAVALAVTTYVVSLLTLCQLLEFVVSSGLFPVSCHVLLGACSLLPAACYVVCAAAAAIVLVIGYKYLRKPSTLAI